MSDLERAEIKLHKYSSTRQFHYKRIKSICDWLQCWQLLSQLTEYQIPLYFSHFIFSFATESVQTVVKNYLPGRNKEDLSYYFVT